MGRVQVLSNAYNLKVHMSIHDGLNHQCSICGHTSKSRDALRKHLAYRHLIGQSGPVRPRMPTATKRRKLNPATGQMEVRFDLCRGLLCFKATAVDDFCVVVVGSAGGSE